MTDQLRRVAEAAKEVRFSHAQLCDMTQAGGLADCSCGVTPLEQALAELEANEPTDTLPARLEAAEALLARTKAYEEFLGRADSEEEGETYADLMIEWREDRDAFLASPTDGPRPHRLTIGSTAVAQARHFEAREDLKRTAATFAREVVYHALDLSKGGRGHAITLTATFTPVPEEGTSSPSTS